jgi:hypothetical protein
LDQAYLEYPDTQLKKESEISIKNGLMKSYKILRAQDDDAGWNMLILREYASYASLEKSEEKADEVLRGYWHRRPKEHARIYGSVEDSGCPRHEVHARNSP